MDFRIDDEPVPSAAAATPAQHLPPDGPPKTRQKKKTKRSECSICNRSLANSAFPKISDKCDHTRDTCRKCWNAWLKEQIDSVAADQIGCVQCSRILEESDIRKLARPASYAAYLDTKLKASLSVDPDFHWCIMPGCGSGQISSGNIFTCTKCKVKSCVACAVEWHEGETCDQYQHRTKLRSDEEDASELTVARISKQCPGCKTKITRICGCDHMTCTQCREEFCWRCLADYRGIRQIGSSHHKPDCYHYLPLPPQGPFPAPVTFTAPPNGRLLVRLPVAHVPQLLVAGPAPRRPPVRGPGRPSRLEFPRIRGLAVQVPQPDGTPPPTARTPTPPGFVPTLVAWDPPSPALYGPWTTQHGFERRHDNDSDGSYNADDTANDEDENTNQAAAPFPRRTSTRLSLPSSPRATRSQGAASTDEPQGPQATADAYAQADLQAMAVPPVSRPSLRPRTRAQHHRTTRRRPESTRAVQTLSGEADGDAHQPVA
ncbi:uncharacterized protein RCC_10679 [Ramularia collo-cygni]|uniref:RBR-type E3 ubiquitin transferase n=1 Tax=Ramularia collo-cygni TaxID=112498 RepID=A0A2D3VD12_9PEZI|nr:uncharacterized protein RCC_10679 [Ramularia collo-cygni]CZT24950.1 uncharacterized protein RCC_10679 [Ramularia collo-cygni]